MTYTPPNSAKEEGSTVERVLREGWSWHLRLQQSGPPQAERQESHEDEVSLERWRQVVAPDQHENFTKRLLWDGIDKVRLAMAFNPPAGALPGAPKWGTILEALQAAGRSAADAPLCPIKNQPLSSKGRELPFVDLWLPASDWALQELHRRCGDLACLRIGARAWQALACSLLERLCGVTEQSLWELFNRERTPGVILLAHLGANGDGSSPPVRETYARFVQHQLVAGYEPLLGEFPVLGRLLATVVQLWLEANQEMFERIEQSRDALAQAFNISLQAELSGIRQGLSDPHRGGRTVAILTFTNEADEQHVVYKPKDMSVDQAYQRYLATLNGLSDLPPLRTLTVLARESYGFMELVEHRPCRSEQQLAYFYHNTGRLMAVLYLLGCTDCHYENLIASGDQLVLIDTETLLEPDPADHINTVEQYRSGLNLSLQDSVLRTGLLPRWLFLGRDRKIPFDVSALGVAPPEANGEAPAWLAINTDGMMAGRSRLQNPLPTSLPVEYGSPQRFADFVDELCEGFTTQMQVFLSHRVVLMEALEHFRGLRRRLLVRHTRLYLTIQQQMLESASLRSAFSQGLRLEHLSRSYLLADQKPLNWPMFKAELRQMERLDIPFFEHLIDSDDLPLPEGLDPISGFLKTNSLKASQNRLEALDQATIDFQIQLIRGAIQVRHVRPWPSDAVETQPTSVPAFTSSPLDNGMLLKESERLAELIWSRAIQGQQQRPEWLGIDVGTDGESFRFGLLGTSLYDGTAGIAMLFATLAQTHALSGLYPQAERWRSRAMRVIDALMQTVSQEKGAAVFRWVRDQPFGLIGTGGILLTLQLLEGLGCGSTTEAEAILLRQLSPQRIVKDESLDLMVGVAGLIGPLLRSRLPNAKPLAILCGQRLLDTQQEAGGWIVRGHPLPLTSFSHGAAGIGAALARLAVATGRQDFAVGVRRALAYERSAFDATAANWPIFHSQSEPMPFIVAWCNGAPGIALSRLCLHGTHLWDAQAEADLMAALATTSADDASPTKGTDHLCCGRLGLSAILRHASASLSKPDLLVAAQRFETASVRLAAESGGNYRLFSTQEGQLNLPGLFTGIAGIALALLEASRSLQILPMILSGGLLPRD